jgi:hypothetical protein
MFRRSMCFAIVSVAGLLVVPATAAAQSWLPQDAAAHLAGGYAVVQDSATDRVLPRGWFGDGSLRVSPHVAVALEAGGAYRRHTDTLGVRDQRIHTFLGGVRVSRAARSRLAPFAQVLIGTGCYCGSTEHPEGFQVGLAVQAGGGLNVRIVDRVGLRVQADARNVRDGGRSFHQWRVALGPVIRIWER